MCAVGSPVTDGNNSLPTTSGFYSLWLCPIQGIYGVYKQALPRQIGYETNKVFFIYACLDVVVY